MITLLVRHSSTQVCGDVGRPCEASRPHIRDDPTEEPLGAPSQQLGRTVRRADRADIVDQGAELPARSTGTPAIERGAGSGADRPAQDGMKPAVQFDSLACPPLLRRSSQLVCSERCHRMQASEHHRHEHRLAVPECFRIEDDCWRRRRCPCLQPGGTVPVTLTFAGGAELTTNFTIEGPRGR
jgi:hypothetical protein